VLLDVCKGVNAIIKQVIASLFRDLLGYCVSRMCTFFVVHYPQPPVPVSLSCSPSQNDECALTLLNTDQS